MKMYFPEIYPDELVYSWFCRYAVYSGHINSKMTMAQLFYSVKNNPSVEFIGHLNRAAEEQIENVYNLDALLMEHTMFSQYARFLPISEQKKAFEKIRKYDDPRKAVSVLPQTEKYLKYCPMCVKEDREIYGETFWHRRHQIRNVSVCTVHQCKIKSSEILTTSQKIFGFYPAEVAIKDTVYHLSDNIEKINFATYVTDLFYMDMKKDVQVRAVIYSAMSATKYMKGQHRNMRQFAMDLHAYFKKMEISEIATMSQIQRVMLGESSEFSVICQIIYFLKVNKDRLFDFDNSRSEVEREQKSHYIKNNAISDWEKFDRENAIRLENFCIRIYSGSANEKGRPERVSEKMICKFLGITIYGLRNMPECMAIFEKYAESYEKTWARKIIWAYKKLQSEEENRVIYWSDLRKLSGVKKKHFPDILIYLRNYTDMNTAKSIEKLIGKN